METPTRLLATTSNITPETVDDSEYDSSAVRKPKQRKQNKKTKQRKNYDTSDYDTPGDFSDVTATSVRRKIKTKSNINNNNNSNKAQRQDYKSKPDWEGEDIINMDTDFDFQANLNRFDKKTVFQELRAMDQVNPSNRLVAHNKPTENPQSKYGHNEMIIEKSNHNDKGWGLESTPISEEYEDDESDTSFDDSKNIYNLSELKKNLPNTTASTASITSTSIQLPTPPAQTIPRKERLQSKASIKDLLPQLTPIQSTTSSGSTQIISSLDHMPCPSCSPIQFVEVERVCTSTYGISEEILIENGARGIAQLVVQAFGGSSRVSSKNHNSLPLVVILAGNNRAGAQALAAGRQLINRNVRVVAIIIGLSKDDELSHSVKLQVKSFKSSGGKIASRIEQLEKILDNIDSPPEIIIDGIQGYRTSLTDLWDDDLQTTLLLINWANQQKAVILSIDIPSGIDASSGQKTPNQLFINSKWVVSLGLPLSGIPNAYASQTVIRGDWIHYLVDVGFPPTLFTKGNMRKFNREWFGADWIVPLEISN